MKRLLRKWGNPRRRGLWLRRSKYPAGRGLATASSGWFYFARYLL